MSELETPTPAASPDAPRADALWIVLFIVFIDLLGFGIILPQLPFFAKKFNASVAQIEIVFSIFSLCQFVAAPVLGLCSDKFGRRPVLIFSQLGSAAGYVLLGFATQHDFKFAATGLGLVYLARVIDGVTGGNISTAQAYISDITTPATRARGMGLMGAAFGIGFAVGPALAGIIGNDTDRASWPAFAAALFSLTAAVLSWLRLPESRPKGPGSEEAWLHPSRFLPILRHRVLGQLIISNFVAMTAFTMLEGTIGIFLAAKFTHHGQPWGQRELGWYFGYIGLFIMYVQGRAMGQLVKRWGEWRVTILGGLLVAVAMGVYVGVGIYPTLWLLLVAGAINAIGRSLQQPPISSLLSKITDRSQQGTVFGLYQGLSSLARTLGPLFASLFFYHVFNAGQYVVAGAMMLAVSVWIIRLRMISPAAPADTRATTVMEPMVEPA